MTEDYRTYAGDAMDGPAMEAQVAEAEQGADMDQAVRHNVYVGWVLAMASLANVSLHWQGGNTVTIAGLDAALVIPYPPETWAP